MRHAINSAIIPSAASAAETQGYEHRTLCKGHSPERVAAHGNGSATRPQPRWGCETPATFTQGSSSLATLGLVAESLWDSFQKIPGNKSLPRSSHACIRWKKIAKQCLTSRLICCHK